jgi:hypothetical protein
VESQSFDGNSFQIFEDFNFGFFKSEIKVVATLSNNNAMVADGVDVNVFDVDVFVFGGEETEEMIFIEVRKFVEPVLGIGAYSPSVDFVGIGEYDTCLFWDDKPFDFISFGYTGKIDFFKDENILFAFDSLFESFFFNLLLIIELLVLGLLFTLVFVNIFGLFFVVGIVVIWSVVIVVFVALFVSVHAALYQC